MTEHGWNDPPQFSFSSLQSGANRKVQMTKRVNHFTSTLNGNGSTSTESTHTRDTTSTPPTLGMLANSAPSSGAPPPPPPTSYVKDKTNVQSDTMSCDIYNKCSESTSKGIESGEEAESRTFDQVLSSLTELTEKHCETVQKRTLDEIKRRLAILSKQWEEGRLSPPVQTEMTKLTTALERGDSQTADSIHVALMVDHTSEVNQWMVGVKRLIATMKPHSRT